LTPQAFIHLWLQRPVLASNPCDNPCILHARVIPQSLKSINNNLFTLLLRSR
jgi:hypothetical protein